MECLFAFSAKNGIQTVWNATVFISEIKKSCSSNEGSSATTCLSMSRNPELSQEVGEFSPKTVVGGWVVTFTRLASSLSNALYNDVTTQWPNVVACIFFSTRSCRFTSSFTRCGFTRTFVCMCTIHVVTIVARHGVQPRRVLPHLTEQTKPCVSNCCDVSCCVGLLVIQLYCALQWSMSVSCRDVLFEFSRFQFAACFNSCFSCL